MKRTYIIREMQNRNSLRDILTMARATSLTVAKRIATRKQCFHGTVLTIEAENGTLLAYKEFNKWSDVD